MHQKAQRRDKPAIKALGKMAAEDAVETLVEYVDTDSDPGLQKVTFKALGEIGSEEATQPLANKLEMDNDNVRPHAARALGLLGDTRAIGPLSDALADDESANVRSAAAWALRQIGTEEALEAAADYVDDRSYLVQHEAELAAEALEVGREAPTA
jgi:HEAT repeat protein